MNTKEYCRPEVKVFVFTTEGGFATVRSGYDHKWKTMAIWSLLNLRNGNQMPWNKITNN